MIAQLRQLRERAGNTRERTRQIVLALFALGLIYLLSGARPLLLAAIVIVLIFAARHVARQQQQSAEHATAPAPMGALDFEQALEELLGMVGREVIVLLALGRGTPPGLADLQGTLLSAELDGDRYQRIDERYRDAEVLFVAVGDSGFWVPRQDFVSAQRVDQHDRVGVELVVGDLRIAIFDDQASRLSDIRMERSGA